MKDEILKRDEIASPCVNICVIHPQSGICVGCHRTLDEIAGWSGMSDAERSDLSANLPDRAPLLRKRRGGRAARNKPAG
jgi:predicted Fe-S protein YdhL (DUF1289 family)